MGGLTCSFSKTLARLERYSKLNFNPALHKAGKVGVNKLAAATPRDTGKASESWIYEIEQISSTSFKIIWKNTDKIATGEPLVVLIEYGHGVRGGYVPPVEFIGSAFSGVPERFIADIQEELRL